MKIVFVISAMDAGGAQRVMSLMANHWAESGCHISIVTISDDSSFYELNSKVELIGLGLQREPGSSLSGLAANISRIRSLQKKLKSIQPDLVISFLTQTNIITAIACKSAGIPVIISERIDPEKAALSLWWKLARRMAYPLAAALVVQTKYAQAFFRDYKLITEVIFNPVKKADRSNIKREKIVLAAGRLTRQKGFDLLIKAFSEVSSKDWQLIILGEGPEKEALLKLISALNIENRVRLNGLVKDMDRFFSRASIFVLSSRFEGFPNVLCEAMSAGLPCISLNCPAGPSEIIDQNVNGILVENEKDLAAAINRLISDESQRDLLGNNALKKAGKLGPDRIMARWEDLIQSILDKSL